MKSDLLHSYCTNRWGFEVVAAELTAREGIAAVARSKPDLVLASVPPPDLNVVNFVERLRHASDGSKLVLLMAQYNEYLVHTLSATEYDGLVFESVENLFSFGNAIEQVLTGNRFISAPIAHCQTTLRIANAGFPKIISKREKEVLICIGHSLSDKEIGIRLGLSSWTALAHRRAIMDKLDIHSTPKLIRFCAEKGFNSVPPPPRSHRTSSLGEAV